MALAVMTLMAAAFLRTARRMTRLEGGALVALYTTFLVVTVAASFGSHP